MNGTQGRLQPGHLIAGRYQVAALLGVGEMGEVYDVRDTSTGYAYALKLLSPEALRQTDAWNAYQRDAQAAAALPFETIAKSYEFGIEAQTGAAYVLGEFVTMPTLVAMLQTSGPLPVAAVEAIIRDLAPALDQAHASGIVHRGLKPQNLFTTPDENGIWKVRVSDFGLANLRKMMPPPPGWVATPGWLSAEQVDPAAQPTAAMDIYTLGLIAFYALTGRSPFMALNREQLDLNLLWAEMTAPMPLASVRARELGATLSPTFDPWFSKALALSAAQRFHNVAEMSQMLFGMVGASQHVVTVRPPANSPAVPVAPPHRTAKGTMVMGQAGPGQMDPNMMAFQQAQAQQGQAAQAQAGYPQQPQALPSPSSQQETTDSLTPPKKSLPIVPIAIVAVLFVLGFGGTMAWFLFLRPSPKPVAAKIQPSPALSDTAAVPDPSAIAAAASASAEAAAAAASASAAAAVAAADPAKPATDALIKFTCEPECEEVKCDGKKLDDMNAGVRLTPGKHKCQGSKSGYSAKAESFEVKAGEDKTVTLTLKESGGGSAAVAAPPATPSPGAKPVAAGKPAGGKKNCGTFINPCK